MVEIVDFDKIEQEQEIIKNALVQTETTEKSIADVTLSDVHFKVDSAKTYEEQTEEARHLEEERVAKEKAIKIKNEWRTAVLKGEFTGSLVEWGNK